MGSYISVMPGSYIAKLLYLLVNILRTTPMYHIGSSNKMYRIYILFLKISSNNIQSNQDIDQIWCLRPYDEDVLMLILKTVQLLR